VQADKRETLTTLHPYLTTIASVVSSSTNSLYGQAVRTCSYARSFHLNSTTYQQEVECSYDDIDLAFIIKVTDGLEFLQTLLGYPNDTVAPSPPPLSSMRVPPALAMGSSGLTLVFTTKLEAQTLTGFAADTFIKDLQNFAPGECFGCDRMLSAHCNHLCYFCNLLYAADTQVRILSTKQLENSVRRGIIVETAIMYRRASEISLAKSLLASLLSDPTSIFRSNFLPADILGGRIAVTGLNGCNLTAESCGPHGFLYPSTPFGCTCECNPGWQNGRNANATDTYCSGTCDFASSKENQYS